MAKKTYTLDMADEIDIGGILKSRISALKSRKVQEKGIHSPLHVLAKEISEYCGEPKEFAMYLGVIKNLGLSKAYRIFSEIKHSPNVTTRGKLFLFKSKYKKEKINESSKRVRKSPSPKA